MDRIVRIVVAAACVATFACAVLVWSDLRAVTGQPAPGFPLFSNGVVSFAPFGFGEGGDRGVRVHPFERVVAVGSEPVASATEIREHARRAGAGAELDYTLEGLDGARRIERVPVGILTQRHVWLVYVPFLLVGAALLAVGALAVLARPELVSTRLLFAFAFGLGVPMGILVPDHYEAYRLSPWLRGAAFVPSAALLHLGLVFPQRRRPLTRAPRATLVAIYGSASLLLAAHLWGWFHDTRWLQVTAALLVVELMAGFAALTANLAVSARRAPTAHERQQARIVLPGPILMGVGLGLFGLANFLSIRVPSVVQLVPALVIVGCLGYAMLGHNIFEFDAVLRRSATLAVLALLGAATYLGLFTVLHGWLAGGVAWASTVATSLVVLVAIPALGFARERADRLVDGVLFSEQRASRELIRAAAEELGRLRGPDELLHLLRDALARGLGCRSLRVVSGTPDAPLAEVAPRDPDDALELAPADPLYVAIRRGNPVSPAARAEPARRGPSRAAVHRAAQLDAALVVPLPPAPHAIGALLLGARSDGRLYTSDDEALVATLASQAAVALENAHAVQSLRALEARLSAENVHLREEVRLDPALGDLVGRSPAMQNVTAQVRQVAATDVAVLVIGETGTGKELVVRAIHALSLRCDRVLVQVACAALPEQLLESELFGHEKGAFTGATERKLGRLEIADGGTLLLDDVDTLPLAVQAKLLRVLQEGELQKLGAAKVVRVDLRVIAATNRDLEAEVRAGRFREDLYYRLNVVPIRIPPLRERREDIALLVEHFVRSRSAKLERRVRGIAADAMAELESYAWPGNVRELRNVIERALVMHVGDVLRLPAPLVATGAALPSLDEADEVGTASLAELLRRYRRALIDEAVLRAGGSQQEAARILGLHRQSFARMLRDLDARDEPVA